MKVNIWFHKNNEIIHIFQFLGLYDNKKYLHCQAENMIFDGQLINEIIIVNNGEILKRLNSIQS